jgi:hypothetical protein
MAPLDYPGRVTIATALVPIAEMKAHLRITDTAHDSDVSAIALAAQDAILAYLTAAADPAWTPATVPRPVAHAIKLMTTYLYDLQRGDADETTDEPRVWIDIRHLLGRHRDPTLA